MIALSIGHTPTSKGASYNGISEFDLATEWIDKLHALLPDSIIVPTGALKDKVNFINNISPVIALEMHFNSYKVWKDLNKDGLITDDELMNAGRGAETLYYPDSVEGKKLADSVQSNLGRVMSPDRGSKEGWYKMNPKNGPDYFLKYTRCPSIIIEPEFIHRQEIINNKMKDACAAISEGLLEYTS